MKLERTKQYFAHIPFKLNYYFGEFFLPHFGRCTYFPALWFCVQIKGNASAICRKTPVMRLADVQ
jgi:hypothetical protein